MENAKMFENYENAKLINNSELIYDKMCFDYDKLSETEVVGIPLSAFRHNSRLKVAFTRPAHTLIVGATESGKTTGYISPTIQIFAELKNKNSMFITDPKGELFSLHYDKLVKAGYDVKVLNLRNPNASDFWNPLGKFYDHFQMQNRLREMAKEVKVKKNGIIKIEYELLGIRFKSKAEMEREVEFLRDEIRTDVENGLQSFVENLIPLNNSKDPFWDYSARELFSAIIYLFLEDSLKVGSDITRDNFSIKNILEFFSETSFLELQRTFKKCDNSSKAFKMASGFRDAPEGTATSTYCVLSSALLELKNYAIMKLTATSTIDLNELDKKPTAIFTITKDEDDSNQQIVKLFFSQVYEKLVELANNRKERKLSRPFYFIMDEFGNIPRVANISNMITAGRARNIWLVMVIQSFAQLDTNYGRDIREILRDNTNMHIFFGTNDYGTRQEFSTECGMHMVLSPKSYLNAQNGEISDYHFEAMPLVPVSKLNEMEEGECYITRFQQKTLLAKIERSYRCPEFEIGDADIYDIKSLRLNLQDKKYCFNGKFIFGTPENPKSWSDDYDYNY